MALKLFEPSFEQLALSFIKGFNVLIITTVIIIGHHSILVVVELSYLPLRFNLQVKVIKPLMLFKQFKLFGLQQVLDWP